jgi:hypothetical protein
MEIWKSIEGFDGIYEVSNLGRVKSLKRKYSDDDKIRKFSISKGYIRYYLSINAITKPFSAHRLVALAFIHNPENKPQVNHIDGNKLNNRVDNLEWVTSSENQNHALKTGLIIPNCGQNHYRKKLTDKDVLEIRNSNLSESKLSLQYKINRATIGKIKRLESWKHLK